MERRSGSGSACLGAEGLRNRRRPVPDLPAGMLSGERKSYVPSLWMTVSLNECGTPLRSVPHLPADLPEGGLPLLPQAGPAATAWVVLSLMME